MVKVYAGSMFTERSNSQEPWDAEPIDATIACIRARHNVYQKLDGKAHKQARTERSSKSSLEELGVAKQLAVFHS